MKTWKELHLGEEALGGLSAGVIGTVIGFPLDVIKTRLQTASNTGAASVSIFQVGNDIIKKEGASSLYKGIGPPLVSLSILSTMTFASYTFVRQNIGAQHGWDIKNGLAGMACAPAAGIVSTVENFVKTQMQLDNITKKQFQGSFHCVQSLVKSNGPGILYTGFVINTVREATFLGNYFFVYEGMRRTLSENNALGFQSSSIKVAVPIAGGLSGAFSWFLSFPLDCVRAVVQGRPVDQPKRGYVEVVRTLLRERGVRGLYSGASASIARAFLVSGTRFSAYETTLYLIRGGRDGVHR
eukprot:CAMPEP_0198133522 /NCGR_PEP_ID=MMETSP1442-20131203/59609_1 /TAXON_ID= /ORGANISM="Craspedostauros australis, Strain CCMP3328" /LENGTH=296 /DNA_ID=CAMNT_0043794643 /DNA_START=120 /DNA_END=1010 /DNA_ORIENTATION=-